MNGLAISVEGTTDGLQAALKQGADVAEREMAKLQRAVASASTYLKSLEQAQRAASVPSGFKQAAEEAERARGITAGFTRELIVLGHEATQGNFSRMGGSMLVLAERSSFLTGIVHAMISPLGLAAAAAAAFAFEVIKGAHEQDTFNKSLVLTGNYAGQTAASFHAMAQGLASSTTATIGVAKDVVQELISTGVVGPKLIADFGQAVVRMSALTGQASEEVVKDFAKMQDGVAKWAEEHNKTMHFLSASQYEYIRTLEDQGKTEEAEKVVLEALGNQLKEAERNLGSFAKAWRWVKDEASGAIDAIERIGKADTFEDQIAAMEMRRKAFLASRGAESDQHQSQPAKFMATPFDAELANLRQLKKVQDDLTSFNANYDETQRLGNAARKRLDDMLAQERGAQGLHKALEELQRDFDRAAKAGTPYSDAEKKTLTDNVTHKFTPRADLKLTNEFEATKKSLEDEDAKIRAQTLSWKEYGKQLDESKEAVIRFRTSQGDLSKMTEAQKSALIGLAHREDIDKAAENAAKETAAAKQRVEALENEAKARQQSARDLAIEQKVRTAIGQSTDAELTARAKSAAAAIYDKEKSDAFAKSLAEQSAMIDKEINSLNDQAALIGKSTLQRQEAAYAIKIQAQEEKLLAEHIGHEAEIHAWAAEKVRVHTQALEGDYEMQRKFSTGAANAFAKYQEDATNSAKFAETFISGSMSRMEDALTKFVMTGKLSFKDLFSFMAEEFIRQQIRMQMASMLPSSGSSGILGSLGSAFGGGSGAGSAGASAGAVEGGAELFPAVPLAIGTNYVPADNMPALLHKGEAVVPAAYNPAAGGKGMGGDVVIHQTLNIGEGVTTAQLYAAAMQAKDAAKAEILQSIKHRGVFAR